MNYGIVDSGGTKTDWIICNSGHAKYSFETISYNTLNLDSLPRELKDHLKSIDRLHYYGSGVSNSKQKNIIHKQLSNLCENSCHIFIESDLLGAARSVAQNEEAYISILGTGSNFSHYYLGNLIQQKPSLGYIIGDEGSGCNIGRALIKAYFYNEMPEKEMVLFENEYNLTKSVLLENLRKKQHQAKYLAQFSKIITKYKTDYFEGICYKEIDEFFERKICPSYQNKAVPVHFIGSISYFYSHLIKKICLTQNIKLGQIIQKPITGLINYHNE